MTNKIIKGVLCFVCSLSIYLLCSALLADSTPEQQIVKVNGIQIYKIPADQLISAAKERNIYVSEKIAPDVNIEYTIADSKLSAELLNLYNSAMSNSRSKNNRPNEGNIILQENTEDDNNILEAIQVHKTRFLIIGVRFLRK
jgi:hypothetical protein